MKINAVLFDLDGTLLPMDQEIFIKAYFGGIVKTLAKRGYDPEAVGASLRSSIRAMMKNDGRVSNEEMFWQCFRQILGDGIKGEEGLLEEFYRGEFQLVRQVCGYTPIAKEMVDAVKRSGLRVILATSPLFPRIATESRIRWAGLEPEDFEYITTFENSNYCKPNPLYYTDLLEKLGLSPEECVMIGNDVGDDMVAAELGMQTFLLTDCLINRQEKDISNYRHGGFDDLIKYMEELI